MPASDAHLTGSILHFILLVGYSALFFAFSWKSRPWARFPLGISIILQLLLTFMYVMLYMNMFVWFRFGDNVEIPVARYGSYTATGVVYALLITSYLRHEMWPAVVACGVTAFSFFWLLIATVHGDPAQRWVTFGFYVVAYAISIFLLVSMRLRNLKHTDGPTLAAMVVTPIGLVVYPIIWIIGFGVVSGGVTPVTFGTAEWIHVALDLVVQGLWPLFLAITYGNDYDEKSGAMRAKGRVVNNDYVTVQNTLYPNPV